jgi:hypothetical protein
MKSLVSSLGRVNAEQIHKKFAANWALLFPFTAALGFLCAGRGQCLHDVEDRLYWIVMDMYRLAELPTPES